MHQDCGNDSEKKKDDKVEDAERKKDLEIYKDAIRTLVKYANLTEEELEKRIQDFKKKWKWGKFCDCRVPEEDRWIFYFFTFSSSDTATVCNDIEAFKKKFGDIKELVKGIEKMEKADLYNIKKVRKTFEDVAEKAPDSKKKTSSRSVNAMCSEIIEAKDKIMKCIDKSELILSRKVIKDSERKVKELEHEVEKNAQTQEELNNKVGTLQSQINRNEEDMGQLKDMNEKLETDLKAAKDDFEEIIKNLKDQMDEEKKNQEVEYNKRLQDLKKEMYREFKKLRDAGSREHNQLN